MSGRLSLVVVLTVAALAPAAARAGIDPFVFTTDVTMYSCRELLALDEPRQNLALLYFSGYMDGQRGLVQFDMKVKAEVIDKVMAHCRNDAAGSVLDAFRRLTP